MDHKDCEDTRYCRRYHELDQLPDLLIVGVVLFDDISNVSIFDLLHDPPFDLSVPYDKSIVYGRSMTQKYPGNVLSCRVSSSTGTTSTSRGVKLKNHVVETASSEITPPRTSEELLLYRVDK